MNIDVEEDGLLCKICSNSLIDRDPRILSCHHTFCLKCLRQIRGLCLIQCPICDKKVTIPDGEINKFPKLSLQAIESMKIISSQEKGEDNKDDTEKFCLDHKSKIIKPILCCKTCKKVTLCKNCIDLDHSDEKCQVVTLHLLKQGLKELKMNFKELITNQKVNYKRSEILLLTDIEKSRKICNFKIDNYFENKKKKIKKYFYKKNYELDFNSKIYKNLFLHDNDMITKIKRLSKEKLPIINNPSIKFPIDFNYYFSNKINYLSKNDMINIDECKFCITDKNSFHISNDGFYYINNGNLMNLHLKSTNSTNSTVETIKMNREIYYFIITNGYIFAIENHNFNVLYCKKPFDNFINFQHFNDIKASLISANEDEYGETYLISLTIDDKRCQYFINEKSQWFINNCKNVGCILNNGYPIIEMVDKRLVLIDKYNGLEIKWINYLKNSIQYDLSPYGLLITTQNNDYGNSKHQTIMKLYQYDYNLKKIKRVSTFYDSHLLGISKQGFIYIYYTFDEKYVTYEIK